MLADQFAELIDQHGPASIAIIGCAGGNGLDRIDSGFLGRIVAVDINPEYIAAARLRHGRRLENLELHCADIQSERLQFDPVELIYAALVLEYVDIPSTSATLKRNLRPRGTLGIVLQLPHSDQQTVSASSYKSLDKLASVLKLVAPEDLRAHAAAAGFSAARSVTMSCIQESHF